MDKLTEILTNLRKVDPAKANELTEAARAARQKTLDIIKKRIYEEGYKVGPQEWKNIQQYLKKKGDAAMIENMRGRGIDPETVDTSELGLRRAFEEPEEVTAPIDLFPGMKKSGLLPSPEAPPKMPGMMESAGKVMQAEAIPQRIAFGELGKMMGAKPTEKLDPDDPTAYYVGDKATSGADLMRAAGVGQKMSRFGKALGDALGPEALLPASMRSSTKDPDVDKKMKEEADILNEVMGLAAEMGVDPIDLFLGGPSKFAKLGAIMDRKTLDKVFQQILKKKKPTVKDVHDAVGGSAKFDITNEKALTQQLYDVRENVRRLYGKAIADSLGIPSNVKLNKKQMQKVLDKVAEIGEFDPKNLRITENFEGFGGIYPGTGKVDINKDLVTDTETLLSVLGHEIGGHGQDLVKYGDRYDRLIKFAESAVIPQGETISDSLISSAATHMSYLTPFEAQGVVDLAGGKKGADIFKGVSELMGTGAKTIDDATLRSNVDILMPQQQKNMAAFEEMFPEAKFNQAWDMMDAQKRKTEKFRERIASPEEKLQAVTESMEDPNIRGLVMQGRITDALGPGYEDAVIEYHKRKAAGTLEKPRRKPVEKKPVGKNFADDFFSQDFFTRSD